MKDIRDIGIPEFKTLEEEKEYWEARGPLAERHRGTINKPKAKQKRSSFLAVRLTGEELTRLRDAAAQKGLGPSTFARMVLTNTIERQNQLKTITMDQLMDIFEYVSPHITDRAENLIKKIAVGDPENPAMLVIDADQKKEYEELSLSLIKTLLKLVGIQLVTSEKEDYQKVKEIANSQAKNEEIRI